MELTELEHLIHKDWSIGEPIKTAADIRVVVMLEGNAFDVRDMEYDVDNAMLRIRIHE